MSDYAELRRLAEAATPGPWRVTWSTNPWPSDEEVERAREYGPWREHWIAAGPNNRYVVAIGGNREEHLSGILGDTAAYIAAANPQAILALLDELEDLRQTAEAATRHAEWWRREALRRGATPDPEAVLDAMRDSRAHGEETK